MSAAIPNQIRHWQQQKSIQTQRYTEINAVFVKNHSTLIGIFVLVF